MSTIGSMWIKYVTESCCVTLKMADGFVWWRHILNKFWILWSYGDRNFPPSGRLWFFCDECYYEFQNGGLTPIFKTFMFIVVVNIKCLQQSWLWSL